MVFKIPMVFIICFVISSCNKKQPIIESASEKKEKTKLSKTAISNLNFIEFELDNKTSVIVEPWEAYTKLTETVKNIKNANFSFFELEDEEAIANLVKDLRTNLPDTLNTQSVLSRITIVENMLYKLEDTQKLSNTTNTELRKSIEDFLIAFSNLNFQFNKKLEKDAQDNLLSR